MLCTISKQERKKVSVNAEKYLLSVMEEGKKKRDMFVNECNKDSNLLNVPKL